MHDLAERLAAATGADPALDAALAEAYHLPAAAYTASVEDARALVAALLPDWRLHLGFGATGMFPYAALSKGDERSEAEAPCLALAVVRAAVKIRLDGISVSDIG